MSARDGSKSPDDSLATRASLLGRIRNWEDSQSWEEFTQIYSRLIRSVAIKSGLSETEARDVEQETLLSVARKIHEFEADPARGTFKSWLLTLTRWRIIDQFRKRVPSGATGDAPAGAGTAANPAPGAASEETLTRTATVERVAAPEDVDAHWETEWKRNMLEGAFARVRRRIKPKHLQVFDLYSRRNWSAPQVARELGVSLVQVYIVNHRITKMIRQEVETLRRSLE